MYQAMANICQKAAIILFLLVALILLLFWNEIMATKHKDNIKVPLIFDHSGLLLINFITLILGCAGIRKSSYLPAGSPATWRLQRTR